MFAENKKRLLLIEHFGGKIQQARTIEYDEVDKNASEGTCKITQGNDTEYFYRDFIFDHSHEAPSDLEKDSQGSENPFEGTILSPGTGQKG